MCLCCWKVCVCLWYRGWKTSRKSSFWLWKPSMSIVMVWGCEWRQDGDVQLSVTHRSPKCGCLVWSNAYQLHITERFNHWSLIRAAVLKIACHVTSWSADVTLMFSVSCFLVWRLNVKAVFLTVPTDFFIYKSNHQHKLHKSLECVLPLISLLHLIHSALKSKTVFGQSWV